MGWIVDVLIAFLAACAVGAMIYQKVRGKSSCSCAGCTGGSCGACNACNRQPEKGRWDG
ncbi:MAG TPA: FeoB-associated Cys-rich membrane protein [Candidatus Fimivicinus intestinavium]|nr:FeoB-associated Cys-rich membrane protein [Candidatus Fimivicinus intestinavium]